MTRAISTALRAHYASGTTTIASCWKATLTDGTVIAATTHVEPLEIDGVTYEPVVAFNASDVENSSDLSVDNMEVDGFLASPAITVDDVHSGRWDYAEIELFEVNYRDLTMGRNLIRSGTLGQVKAGRSIFTAELRGLTQKLSRRIVRLTTQECPHDFGDARCRMNKADWTVYGTVGSVEERRIITDSSRTEPDDWFTGGLLTFTSGVNNGRSMEVKRYTVGVIELWEQMPSPIRAVDTVTPVPPGSDVDPSAATPDTYTMLVGDQKRFYQDCIGKFNNAINFGGFPHLPGVGVFGGPGTVMTPATVPGATPGSPPPPPSPSPAPGPAPAPTPAPGPGAPASGASPSPFAIGVNVHEGGSSLSENTAIVNLLSARGLSVVRMDLYNPPANPTLVHDFVTKAVAAGITVQGILMTSAQSDHTVYTGGSLATWESTNYADAAAIVAVYKPLGVTDYELLNEIDLRSEITTQVPANGSGNGDESAYSGSSAATSIGSALKGMADAVHAAGGCRVILGTTGRDWGFLKYMQTLGVNFDVVGYHVYPKSTDSSLRTDTWYGTGGAIGQLNGFGKPYTINEFNSGEIYFGGYGNAEGDGDTEDGFTGLAFHLGDLYDNPPALLESIVTYELEDETFKSAPESDFGLTYDINNPKVSLYIVTAFAGGTLSSGERLEITSRGLLSDAEIDAMQPGVGSGAGAIAFGSRSQSYAAGVITPSDTTTAMDNFIKSQYDGWVANLLRYTPTAKGQIPAGGYWVQFSDTNFSTVSEGMGYGMLITAIMAGYDPAAQQKFDGLFKTVRAFPSDGTSFGAVVDKLMSWRVGADGSDQGGAWPALDGDLDMALALLMAHAQWGSAGTYNYLAEAQAMIAQIKGYGLDVATGAVIGSNTLTAGRTSDYMIGHFRSFKKYTGDTFWDLAVSKQKAIIEHLQTQYAPSTGLLPDWAGGVKTTTPFPTNDVSDGGNANKDDYWYNACRDPWRMGTDYVLSGDPAIRTQLTRMEDFFVRATGGVVTNIINGYALDGTGLVAPNPYWIASEFYNSMMVGALCDSRYRAWVDALWAYSKAHPETGYYGTEIQLLCAIVASGNWWAP